VATASLPFQLFAVAIWPSRPVGSTSSMEFPISVSIALKCTVVELGELDSQRDRQANRQTYRLTNRSIAKCSHRRRGRKNMFALLFVRLLCVSRADIACLSPIAVGSSRRYIYSGPVAVCAGGVSTHRRGDKSRLMAS